MVGCHVLVRDLKRVYALRVKIFVFLKKQKHVFLAEKFNQEKFIANVAYLADLFNSLSCLNRSMQGPGFIIIGRTAKIIPYNNKLIFWGKVA